MLGIPLDVEKEFCNNYFYINTAKKFKNNFFQTSFQTGITDEIKNAVISYFLKKD
jgi:hypothetical protein